MIHYDKRSNQREAFCALIHRYKKEKEKNENIQFFIITEILLTSVYQIVISFSSDKLRRNETKFIGKGYFNFTEEVDQILNNAELLSDKDAQKAFIDRSSINRYEGNLYAATPYQTLNTRFEQHSFIKENISVLSANELSSFHVGTKEEFHNFLKENYDPNNTIYSLAYKQYKQIEKELKEAKKNAPLYCYTSGRKDEGNFYEERAYYVPKTRSYYVDALGGPFSKIGINEKEVNAEFSRLEEEEFVDFIHEKIEIGEIKSIQELGGTPEFERLYKKHRLKYLFEKK